MRRRLHGWDARRTAWPASSSVSTPCTSSIAGWSSPRRRRACLIRDTGPSSSRLTAVCKNIGNARRVMSTTTVITATSPANPIRPFVTIESTKNSKSYQDRASEEYDLNHGPWRKRGNDDRLNILERETPVIFGEMRGLYQKDVAPPQPQLRVSKERSPAPGEAAIDRFAHKAPRTRRDPEYRPYHETDSRHLRKRERSREENRNPCAAPSYLAPAIAGS